VNKVCHIVTEFVHAFKKFIVNGGL